MITSATIVSCAFAFLVYGLSAVADNHKLCERSVNLAVVLRKPLRYRDAPQGPRDDSCQLREKFQQRRSIFLVRKIACDGQHGDDHQDPPSQHVEPDS